MRGTPQHYMLLPIYNRARQIVSFASVDECDYKRVRQHRWSQDGNGYPLRQWHGGRQFLHWEVAQPAEGFEVDHINRKTKDARRQNLRVCTHAQNHQNKASNRNALSRHRGVTYDVRRAKWVAKHKLLGRTYNLGRFENEIEAAEAAAAFRAEHMPFSAEGR